MTRDVLLDIAGVLLDGESPLPGAAEALSRIREAGLPLRFLTNTTRRPKRTMVQRLNAAGMEVSFEEVLTPAAAARDWLSAHGYRPHLLVHPDLEEEFGGLEGDRTAVVVGDAGRGFTYERLNDAFRHLAQGAPFLALAANRVFREEDGELSLDAGAFVKALEYSSGTKPLLLGKPAAGFFDAACAGLGCDPSEAVMIGDDAESDVAGALSAGVGRAILVKTGKYRESDESRFDPPPSDTVADIGAAVDLILGEGG